MTTVTASVECCGRKGRWAAIIFAAAVAIGWSARSEAETCMIQSDCLTPGSYCVAGVCLVCTDSAPCGGECPEKCGEYQGCDVTSDCDTATYPGLACDSNECLFPSCSPSDQTAYCGGDCPARCPAGFECAVDSDCNGGKCDTAQSPPVCGSASSPHSVPAASAGGLAALSGGLLLAGMALVFRRARGARR